MRKETTIQEELNGRKGTASVRFINNGYSVPHWASYVTVPYKPSRWICLGGASITEDMAIERAREELIYSLDNCGNC